MTAGAAATSRGDPRYRHIADALRGEIACGRYPAGAPLPSEAALGARFGASRHTVRAALRVLRDDRLVTSRPGAGSYVARTVQPEAFRLEARSIDDLLAYSSDMYTEVRSVALEQVTGRTAMRVGVESGQTWLVVRGVARFRRRQAPICWSDYYIHRDYAALAAVVPRETGPIFLLLEQTFGVSIASMEQTISTAPLRRALCEELKAKLDETAIDVRRVYRTPTGKLAQVSLHTHPSSRFQQKIVMQRLAE